MCKMDRELLKRKEKLKRDMEKRRYLQEITEMLKNINGIVILEIYEVNIIERLKNTEYFSCDRIPESKINCKSDKKDICQWIINCMDFHNGDIVHFIFNNICSKVKLIDVEKAVFELWEKNGSITVLSENDLKEICEDSRDEYNYLFDKYAVRCDI